MRFLLLVLAPVLISLILILCLLFNTVKAQEDEPYTRSELELKEEVNRIHQTRLEIENNYWRDKEDWNNFNQTQLQQQRNNLINLEFQKRYY